MSNAMPPLGEGPTNLDIEIMTHKGLDPYQVSPNPLIVPRRNLQAICKARGLKPAQRMTRAQLQAMLVKANSQPVVYDQFRMWELLKFVKARDLEGKWRDAKSKLVTWKGKKKVPKRKVVIKKAAKDLVTSPLTPVNKATSRTEAKTTASTQTAKKRRNPTGGKALFITVLETHDRKDARFDFLGLPAELRDMVYHFACTASITITDPQQPAVTKTCQLLRAEALPVYYKSNRFGLFVNSSPWPRSGWTWLARDEHPWLQSISPQSLTYVRCFEFLKTVDGNYFELQGIKVDFDFLRKEHSVVLQTHSLEYSYLFEYQRQCAIQNVTEGSRVQYLAYFHMLNQLLPCKPRQHGQERKDLQPVFRSVMASKPPGPDNPLSITCLINRTKRVLYGGKPSLQQQLSTLESEWEKSQGFSSESIKGMVNMLCNTSDKDVQKLWDGK